MPPWRLGHAMDLENHIKVHCTMLVAAAWLRLHGLLASLAVTCCKQWLHATTLVDYLGKSTAVGTMRPPL
jgi:hypothetical protein